MTTSASLLSAAEVARRLSVSVEMADLDMSASKRIPVRFTSTTDEREADRATQALVRWYMDLLRDAEAQERARCQQKLSLVR